MAPAVGLQPLRVGPEDVEASEAGELVKGVGVHHHAKGLIHAVSKQIPRELRTAMQRFEYRERSKHLDEDEVLYQARATVDPEGKGVIERVLSARVKGSKTNPYDGAVVVLYEAPAGRTARCAVLYNPDTFPRSVAAFDQALREGKIELPGELGDRADLRAALESAREEVSRLARENAELKDGDGEAGVDAALASAAAEDQPQGVAPEDIPEDVTPGETPGWPIVNGIVLDLPEEVREKLAEAELAPPSAAPLTEDDLPEGVAPGDPGWPVDEESGELLDLPDSVRQQLIDAAEEAEVAEPEDEVDLNEVDLPEGNADSIIAMVPFLYNDVLKALTLRDERSTVRKAAAEELAERQIELPEGANVEA
jgi:hypothetical protein